MFRMGIIGYRLGRFLLLSLLLCCLVGCASAKFRDYVREPVPFKALVEEGEACAGKPVIAGGYILETVNEPDGTLITVLQAPLGSRYKPRSQDLSEGRFLVHAEKFLDPEIYTRGRKLTVGGRVSGVRSLPLGNRLYGYPVIEAGELYLWPKEEPYSRRNDPCRYYWGYPWHHYPYYPYPWWAW